MIHRAVPWRIVMLVLPPVGFAAAGIGLAREGAFAHSYIDLARNLVDLGLYSRDGTNPTAYRLPLYPLLLAASMLTGGEGWTTVAILVQAGIAALCLALVLVIVARLSASRAVAAVAGALVLLDAPMLAEFVHPRETGLFCLLVLSYFLVLTAGRSGPITAAALGIASGLAMLTRPSGVLLLPLSAVVLLLLRREPPTKRIRDLLLYGVVVAAVLSPWQVYLHRTFGVVSLAGSSSGGRNLFKGNHPVMGNIVPALDVDHANPAINAMLATNGIGLSDAQGAEWAREAWLRERAIDAIRADPAGFLWRSAGKAMLFLAPLRVPLGEGSVKMTPAGVLAVAAFEGTGPRAALYILVGLTIVPFGLGGLLLAAAAGGPARAWAVAALLFVLANTALYAVTFPETRLRFPLDPLLAIGAAWLASTAVRGLGRSRPFPSVEADAVRGRERRNGARGET